MASFLQGMEPLLLLSGKIQNFSGMAIRQVTESLSNVPCGDDEATEAMPCRDEATAFRLKMVAMAAILLAGAIGVMIPLIGVKRRLIRTYSPFFSFLKSFAAGVILATGFVHMLSDGQSALSDPCLPKSPWSDFPFPGFVAMLSSLATLLVDCLGTQFYEKKHRKDVEAVVRSRKPSSSAVVVDEDGIGIVNEEPSAAHAHLSTSHGHCHEPGGAYEEHVHSRPHSHGDGGGGHHSPHVSNAVVSQILELGIVSHSVIIGLSLGVSHSPCIIRPLIGALSFHQFFEGFALGGCISQAQFRNLVQALMACFFAVTTPAGIAAGMALSSFYDPNSPRALVVEGLLDCISAGILIYMALIDLIAADFLSHKMSSSGRLQVASFFALFLGAGSMSLLALWA